MSVHGGGRSQLLLLGVGLRLKALDQGRPALRVGGGLWDQEGRLLEGGTSVPTLNLGFPSNCSPLAFQSPMGDPRSSGDRLGCGRRSPQPFPGSPISYSHGSTWLASPGFPRIQVKSDRTWVSK